MNKENLPTNWKIVRLGEVYKFTQKPRNLIYSAFESIPFVPMEYIPDSGVFFNKFILKSPKDISSGTYFENGDLLLSKITPSFENGKQGIIETLPIPFGIATTEVIPIKDISTISNKHYLFYYLLRNDVRSELAGKMEGSTGRQRLSKSTIENLTIPLPPLPEQQAVARALRAVQQAKEARQRELELERERKAALMDYLFTHGTRGEKLKQTEIGEMPESWEIMLLDQCSYIQTGVAKGRKLNDKNIQAVPYLRVANVQDGYLDLSEIKYIQIRKIEYERYFLQVGDILLTEGGDFDKLGRGCIWKGQIENCVHQNHIFAVRINRNFLLPEYFAYLIQSNYGKSYFLSVAHRTTNLASINSTKLRNFPVILPNFQEQQQIVKALHTCDNKIDVLEKEISLLDELFRAMLEELMTGRLSAMALVEGNE